MTARRIPFDPSASPRRERPTPARGPLRRLAAGLAGLLIGALPAVAQVVINEIDYDQPSTDTAEFIELMNVGPDPVGLDGYSLELVNGAGGGAVVYRTIELPAVELAAGGYFVICANPASTPHCDLTVTPAENLIQNGDPDAVALLFGSAIVDTVSYGGDTAAPYTEGSGTGLDDPTTDALLALSRFPDGVDTDVNNVDFSVRCITPGAANAAATGNCTAGGPPTLVINELDYDQPGTDTAEFVEIYNPGPLPAELDGVELQLVNGNGGGAVVYQTIALPAGPLPAGGYFVVCADATSTPNCDLDVSPDSNLLQNGAPDAVALAWGDVLLDTVSYEGNTGAPYTEGSGAGLEDDGSDANLGLSRFPDGVDTDVNDADFSLRCLTPGAPNSAADSACGSSGPPTLVINEFDYDQPGTDTAEFVEIYNPGSEPAELSGVQLVLVNGNEGGAVVYQTIPLPAGPLAAGGYFVVCADAANTAHCDLDVSPNSNLLQNGAPDALALVWGGTVLDTVSYEGDTGAPYTEGTGSGLEDDGTGNLLGLARYPDGHDTDHNANDFALRCITPGEANVDSGTNCVTGPEQELEIWEIQGPGMASPWADTPVLTRDNVVTAVGPQGFFIQTPPARSDNDPETSDGIYVFTGGAPTVAVGDLVTVWGAVQEFFELTEIAGAVEVEVTGAAAVPAPVDFDATLPSPDQPRPENELERYEGMLVSFSGVASAPSDNFGDAAVVARAERALREPGIEYPGLPDLPVWDGNPEIFEIDPDALGLPHVDLFGGQAVSAAGPLSFAFGDYQVWPTAMNIGEAPPLPRPVRTAAPGELVIATQNIERFFDPVDDPDTDDPVPTPEQYQGRLGKVSRWVREVLQAPDVLVVQEVENLGILEDLADRIASDDPAIAYSAWLIEGHDIGGIDVGMLTRDDHVQVHSVEQWGADIIFDYDGSLLNDRPPLVLEATALVGDLPYDFTLIGVHQRSLSGIEGSGGERVRLKRFEQARHLSEYIQSRQVTNPDIRLVVAGDFNAYEFTDGYVDVLGQVTGDLDPLGDWAPTYDAVEPNLRDEVKSVPAGDRYSYVFDGSGQVLDHILTSSAVQDAVTGVSFARGSADAPAFLLGDPDAALRISDHDGLVVYVQTQPAAPGGDTDADGVTDDIDFCPGTQIPEAVPSVKLKPLRFALADEDLEFETGQPVLPLPHWLHFDTQDTAGCSCEQILDLLAVPGQDQRKHGCNAVTMLLWVEVIVPYVL